MKMSEKSIIPSKKSSKFLSSKSTNLLPFSENLSLISYFSLLIDEIIEENTRLYQTMPFPGLPFDVLTGKINVSVEEYLERIVKLLELDTPEILYTLILLDRFLSSSELVLTKNNVHKLLLTCSYVSNKMLSDNVILDSYYSLVYGVSVSEIIYLENQFCLFLNFRIHVTEETYNEYKEYYELSLKQDSYHIKN